MKIISLIIIVAFVMGVSCTSNKLCTYPKKYLRTDIDTTKEYKLKGVYCFSSVKDTILGDGNNCLINFNVFDRVNGRGIEDGVIYFFGQDTVSIIFNSQNRQKKIKAGDYIVEAWSSGYIGTMTKKITINRDKKMEINFYLGTTVQF